jgi:hypothetical protein
MYVHISLFCVVLYSRNWPCSGLIFRPSSPTKMSKRIHSSSPSSSSCFKDWASLPVPVSELIFLKLMNLFGQLVGLL